MSDIALTIVEYDADKGMKHDHEGTWITMNDGSAKLVTNVEFYDPLQGFIQTKDGHLYMPTRGDLFK